MSTTTEESFRRVETAEWSFSQLEAEILHAGSICARQPLKAQAKITLDARPQSFGSGSKPFVLRNLLSELAALTTLTRTITAWDFADLLSTCLESLDHKRFRIAAMCTRTLLEEYAYAAAYQKDLKRVEQHLFGFRDSEYRVSRFNRMSRDKLTEFLRAHLDLREVLLRRLASQRISTRWSTDTRSRPKDYELSLDNPQRQTGILTVVDKLRFTRNGSTHTARSHYDQLCEVTHPNQLARGVYYDSVAVDAKEMRIVATRPHVSDEIFDTATALIMIPLMESVSGLSSLLNDLERVDNRLHRRIQTLKTLL